MGKFKTTCSCGAAVYTGDCEADPEGAWIVHLEGTLNGSGIVTQANFCPYCGDGLLLGGKLDKRIVVEKEREE